MVERQPHAGPAVRRHGAVRQRRRQRGPERLEGRAKAGRGGHAERAEVLRPRVPAAVVAPAERPPPQRPRQPGVPQHPRRVPRRLQGPDLGVRQGGLQAPERLPGGVTHDSEHDARDARVLALDRHRRHTLVGLVQVRPRPSHVRPPQLRAALGHPPVRPQKDRRPRRGRRQAGPRRGHDTEVHRPHDCDDWHAIAQRHQLDDRTAGRRQRDSPPRDSGHDATPSTPTRAQSSAQVAYAIGPM